MPAKFRTVQIDQDWKAIADAIFCRLTTTGLEATAQIEELACFRRALFLSGTPAAGDLAVGPR